jgi:hypothetical protein
MQTLTIAGCTPGARRFHHEEISLPLALLALALGGFGIGLT